ncbi:MAG: DUF4258 domain-containing protein [Pirellulaceae bacterium]
MVESPHRDPLEIARRLHEQASADEIRVTVHGHREMVDEDISYEAVREALRDCQVLENYPDHQRGACCLVCGRTGSGRFLHIVCTTTLDVIVIITVYKPQRPKWVTPFERGGRNEV